MALNDAALDQTTIQFSPAAGLVLNLILAVVIFGVALELRPADFARVTRMPRAVLAGLLAQWLALPGLTCALVYVLAPAPGIALGMLLVAACPGGNMSNVLCHWARGATALSVTLTAFSTLAAVVVTPLTFGFWAGLNPLTRDALTAINVPLGSLVLSILIALALPLAAGLYVGARHPRWAARVRGPLKHFGLVVFVAFIVLALVANAQAFRATVGLMLGVVALHNGLALGAGFLIARLARLPVQETRAVTLETGIQNSGLALVLIFAHFGGMGGMALVAGWWGVWHLISGGTLAAFWSWRTRRAGQVAESTA